MRKYEAVGKDIRKIRLDLLSVTLLVLDYNNETLNDLQKVTYALKMSLLE